MDFGVLRIYISIHILTRRMTLKKFAAEIYEDISIHILTRRMTQRADANDRRHIISIHILTRRMTAAFGISYSEIQHI